MLIGYQDAWEVGSGAIEHRDVSDAMDEGAARPLRKLCKQSISHRTVARGRRLDLDQLVIV
jgi:hypothetical protein